MTTSSIVNLAAVESLLQSLDTDTSVDAIYRVHNAAKILEEGGSYAIAKRLFMRTLEVCEATLGRHRLTRSCLFQLAIVSIQLNDQPSARDFIDRFRDYGNSSLH